MKTILNQYLIAGVCSVLSLGLVSCSHVSGSETTAVKAVTVKTVKVSNSNETHQREYVGTIESENSVDLSFQVNGNIDRILVQEGQSVQKGQLLATLNTSTLSNNYNIAKISLTQAQDAFDRYSKLYNNNSLPEIKYIEVKSSLEQAQANERIAHKNLTDCNLYAPFSGVIGQKIQEAGANVMPGTPVVTLMSIGTVKVKVAIPENEISSVKVGDISEVKITALGNNTITGRVIEKGVVANAISHTYDIKVELNNPEKEIMPGMVCKAYLTNSNNQDNIIVPLKSVQVDASGKNFVWVADADRAAYKEVKTGELIGNGIAIVSGLTGGENLIVEGYQKLSPGLTVKDMK